MQTVGSFAESIGSDTMILVLVGECPRRYNIQKRVLTEASDWFVKVLSDRFVEGREKILHLPEVDPTAFEYFLFWLFKRRLPTDREQNFINSHNLKLILIRGWIFGDAYFLPQFQNAVMRKLFEEISGSWVRLETVREGYEGTMKDSKLRQLLMREVAQALTVKRKDFSLEELERVGLGAIPGFMTDLINEITKGLLVHAVVSDPAVEDFLVHC